MKLIHYKILVIVLTILLIGTAVLVIQQTGLKSINRISADEAANKVLAYINNTLLQNRATANLINVTEDKKRGLYKLEFKIGSQQLESYVSFDGKTFYPEVVNLETAVTAAPEKVKGGETVDGDFIKLADQEICQENNKPIIYFFGSLSCPHCHWEYPIIKKVVDRFGDKISFRDNMNEIIDKDVFMKYSDGGVPTIVLGCRYYRLGSGEQIGEEKETEILTKLIQELL